MSDESKPGGVETFTLPQIAEIAAIDYRTLHNWQKRGLIQASDHTASGSGTTNRFTQTDALHVLVLAELRRSGVEVRVLESVTGQVRQLAADIDSDRQLLVISQGSVFLSSDTDLGESVSADRPSMVMNLGGPRRALDRLPAAA